MRRGLKRTVPSQVGRSGSIAARAAPYEKGTETLSNSVSKNVLNSAARAAPYEKGTESAVRYPDPPHCIASLQLTVLQDNSPLPPHTHDIRIRGFAVRVSYPHPVAQHARRGAGVCVLRTSGRLRGDARPLSRVADAPLDNSVCRIAAVCLPT